METKTTIDLKRQILELLAEIRPECDFAQSHDFVEDGLLDSFDVVTLVAMLDEKYEISVRGTDIVPENFSDDASIERLLRKNGVQG